jgi:hypothetical protein
LLQGCITFLEKNVLKEIESQTKPIEVELSTLWKGFNGLVDENHYLLFLDQHVEKPTADEVNCSTTLDIILKPAVPNTKTTTSTTYGVFIPAHEEVHPTFFNVEDNVSWNSYAQSFYQGQCFFSSHLFIFFSFLFVFYL